MIDHQSFYANGKLLLTGEYAVLDGAQALAVPTLLGQRLEIVNKIDAAPKELEWNSFDADGTAWFAGKFDLQTANYLSGTDANIGNRLQLLFETIHLQRPNFLQQFSNLQVNTRLTFPRHWGLGSSSTLVHLLSQWAAVDPFQLQFKVFGGSAYDIACAGVNQSILYQKVSGKAIFQTIDFTPPFIDQLYFVYLGKKQDSRKGIAQYRKNLKLQARLVKEITLLTHEFIAAKTLIDLDKIIVQHEALISAAIKMEQVKNLHFKDYWGAVKSLGAWGGDFVLATSERSEEATKDYFKRKGLEVIMKYKELIIN